MATLRDILITVGVDVDTSDIERFDDVIDGAKQRAQGFNRTLAGMGRSMTAFGQQMSLFVTLPIVGASAAMFKLAADAEETASKFDVVFGSVQDAADATAKNLVDNFGLATSQAKQLLGDTGDLLTGFNFSGESALGLSKQVQELAVDLASFTNVEGGAARASQALTKALLGERESVKELGIAILEEDVKARVKQLEAAGRFTDESLRQRKAIATLAIAQEQSKNAIGDFARTSGSTANQIRLMTRDARELAVELGTQLIPIGRSLVLTAREWLASFRDLSPEQKQTIVNMALTVAAIGPVIFIIGKMITALVALQQAAVFIATLAGAYNLAGRAALIAQVKMFLIPLAIFAIAAAIALLIEDFIVFARGGESATGRVIDGLRAMKNSVILLGGALLLMAGFIVLPFAIVPGLILLAVAVIGTAAALIIKNWEAIKEFFVDMATTIGEVATSMWDGFVQGASDAVDSVAKFFEDLPARINRFVAESAIGRLLNFGVRGGVQQIPGVDPLPTAAAINGPGGISSQTSNTNRTTNVNTRIELTVPAGTPESQMDFIERAAESAFDRQFDQRMRSAAIDSGGG